MPMEKEYITTEADRLLALVKQKGELSIEEAAKTLDMPVKTIESYANFFEEEDLVVITYKFTTPYISLKSIAEDVPDIDFSLDHEQKETPFSEIMAEIENSIEILKLKLKSGEFFLLKEEYPKLIKLIKSLLKHKGNSLSLEKTNNLHKSLIDISTKLVTAEKHLNSKKMDNARETFVFLQKEVDSVYSQIKGEEVAPLELPKQVIKAPKAFPSAVSLESVYELMKKGRFEEAEEVYQKLILEYNQMPKDFETKEHDMKLGLEKLQKDLNLSVVNHKSKEMEAKSSTIRGNIQLALSYVEKGKTVEASNLYNKVKKEFSKFPKGFVKETIEINNEILNLYKAIINTKNVSENSTFQGISEQIKDKLVNVKNWVNKKEFNKGINDYNLAVSLFNTLPKIHAPVRNNLKNYLLLVFEKLSAAKQKYFEGNLKSALTSINNHIKEAHRALDNKQFDTAKRIYGHVLEGYKSVPPDYTDSLLPLQERLFEFYKRFSVELEKESLREFEKSKLSIKLDIAKITSYLNESRGEEALELFQKAMVLFNKLPEGFLKEKSNIKAELLEISPRVSKLVDSQLLKGAPQETVDSYNKLLKNISLFFMHVESNEFNLSSIDYRQIRKILTKIPYGVLSNSRLLKAELVDIKGEAAIINQFSELKSAIVKADDSLSRKIYLEITEKLKKLDNKKSHVLSLFRYLRTLVKDAKEKHTLKKVKTHNLATTSLAREVSKNELLKGLKSTLTEGKPGEIPIIAPLADHDESQLKKIAQRDGKATSLEFNKLNTVLNSKMLDTITSQKGSIVLNNKIRMIHLFLDFGNVARARELLIEARKIDPKNPAVIALVGKING